MHGIRVLQFDSASGAQEESGYRLGLVSRRSPQTCRALLDQYSDYFNHQTDQKSQGKNQHTLQNPAATRTAENLGAVIGANEEHP